MEFASYLDEIESDRNGEQLSLHRQRILAAQIKDSELGDDEVLLDNADTFDNAVETVRFIS